MRFDTRFAAWGVFLVLVGAIPLAVNEGLLGRDLLGQIWRLWPLVLIGAGIGLLLRGTPAGVLGGFLVAATMGTIVGSALAVGPAVVGGCGDAREPAATDGPDSAATRIDRAGTFVAGSRVEVDFSCGRLTVDAAGAGWQLRGSEPGEEPPRIEGTAERLRIAPTDGGPQSLPFEGSEAARQWRLTLPSDIRFALQLDINAAQADLELSGLQLERLELAFNASSGSIDLRGARTGAFELDVNASQAVLRLPSASATGRLEVNAGELVLCRAPGVGLQITASGALSDTDFSDSGLVRAGERWRSPDYESADARVDLTVSANAADVDLDPAGGCG